MSTSTQPAISNTCLWHRMRSLLLAVFWMSTAALADDSRTVAIEIQGVDKQLAKQLEGYVAEPRGTSPSAMRHWRRTSEQRLTQVLAALGYNSPSLSSRVDEEGLQLRVALGKATVYRTIELEIKGEAKTDERLIDFVQRTAPLPKQRLVHPDYERFKADLLSIALTLGYFDANYSTHRLAVSRKQHSADLTLILDSGVRYRYGSVNFSEGFLSNEFLQQWVPFEEGDYYNAGDIDVLARGLRDSGYFRGVRVRPEIDQSVDGIVPINVDSTLRKPHSATVGIGYGTDSGPRLKGGITQHYLNTHGHSIGFETKLSTDNHELSGTYRIPQHPDPANHHLQMDAGFATTTVDNTRSKRYSIGVNHQRINAADWAESYSLKFQHEDTEQDGISTYTRVMIPGTSWSREGTVNSQGTLTYNLSLQLNAAREELLSDVSFNRLYLNLGSGYALSDKHLLHTRMELGWLESDNFLRVPFNLRFFAGGDNSVRGFARLALSPQDTEGNAIGGRHLNTLSAEYEYRIRDNLGLAAFIDTGRAAQHTDDPSASGGGLGLRWYSPVGPIKMYIATPLTGDDRSPRFHLSMGS